MVRVWGTTNLCADVFLLEVFLLVLDVLFLHVEKLELALQLFELRVQILGTAPGVVRHSGILEAGHDKPHRHASTHARR